MHSLFFTPQAKQDVKNIRAYIKQENPRVADAVVRKIHSAMLPLVHAPYLGVARDELGDGTRMLPIKSHLIFYRVEDAKIILLRVLHHARDIQPLYFNQ